MCAESLKIRYEDGKEFVRGSLFDLVEELSALRIGNRSC